jgi:hypothetical protein
MSIGEFANHSRLSAKALRLYDELGLLPPAPFMTIRLTCFPSCQRGSEFPSPALGFTQDAREDTEDPGTVPLEDEIRRGRSAGTNTDLASAGGTGDGATREPVIPAVM